MAMRPNKCLELAGAGQVGKTSVCVPARCRERGGRLRARGLCARSLSAIR